MGPLTSYYGLKRGHHSPVLGIQRPHAADPEDTFTEPARQILSDYLSGLTHACRSWQTAPLSSRTLPLVRHITLNL